MNCVKNVKALLLATAMNDENGLGFELMKKKALEQFRSGKSLYGKDGAFAPLLKSFLEAALEAEMESHLDEHERLSGIRRNSKPASNLKPGAEQ